MNNNTILGVRQIGDSVQIAYFGSYNNVWTESYTFVVTPYKLLVQ